MMNNENGRSMVEMLGVLAIIGVLSVAGIAGYSMAMKKYRTNEVLNAASQLVILAQAKYVSNGSEGTANLDELYGKQGATLSGFDMTATCNSSGCDVVSEQGQLDDPAWQAAASEAQDQGHFTITAAAS